MRTLKLSRRKLAAISLLLLGLIAGCVYGWNAYRERREADAVARLKSAGVKVVLNEDGSGGYLRFRWLTRPELEIALAALPCIEDLRGTHVVALTGQYPGSVRDDDLIGLL